jgi:ketosteroid isomerase-like protein
MPLPAPAGLPPVIAAYINATNEFDSAALLGTFADDALVNDMRREFRGKAAIKRWADHEIIDVRVTMEVIEIVEHYGTVIVTARLDGNYDKTGLPDPLVLTFYFMLHSGRIATLIILHNKPAPSPAAELEITA